MLELLSFGNALNELKQGKCIARIGWNGKKMFVYLNKGSIGSVTDDKEDGADNGTIEGIPATLFEKGDLGTVTRLPNINMRAATGSTVTGWLASQTDMLAEVWCVVVE